MLAHSYKSAAELGISQDEVDALISVLYMLEANELVAWDGQSSFTSNSLYMGTFFHVLHKDHNKCGTVGCIAGWANLLSEGKAFPELVMDKDGYISGNGTSDLIRRLPDAAAKLFAIETDVGKSFWKTRSPTNAQLVKAIRAYLVTGSPAGKV